MIPRNCHLCGGRWSVARLRYVHVGERCIERESSHPRVQSPAWRMIVELVDSQP